MTISSAMKYSLYTAAALGGVAGLVAPASGQDGGIAENGAAISVIAEVTVTARRREESLQKVPVAITAINSERLQQQAITTVEDLRFHAPALVVSPSNFGSSVPGYTIRGQRAVNAIASQDGSVNMYFADQVLARVDGTNGVLYDLESVQVLKGPQGTLFGRNSTGGAVLINPRKPQMGSGMSGYTIVEAGNYDMYGGEAAVNVGVSDTLAIRASGKFSRRDGFTKNLVPGGDRFDDDHTNAWRLGILWRPNDAVESYTVYQHFKQNNAGNGLKLTALNPGPLALYLGAAEAMQEQLDQLNAAGFHTVISDLKGVDDVDTYTISNTTSVRLGSVTLKNILGYRKIHSEQTFNYDASTVYYDTFDLPGATPPFPTARQFGIFDSSRVLRGRQLTNEFQVLGSSFDDSLNWIVGAYYFTEDAHDFQASDLAPGFRTNDGQAANDSYSIFAQGTYALPNVQGLSLTAGARYTWDERELEQRNMTQAVTSPAPICRLTQGGTPGTPLDPCSRTNKFDSSALTWTVSVEYQATDDMLLYATHRRGYRSGGLTLYVNRDNEDPDFEPEFVKDYEIGAKSTWFFGDAALRLNAAIYRQDYSDIQRSLGFFDPAADNAFTVQIVNAASAKIEGGEVEATFIPTRYLELSGFYGRVEAEYDRFINDRVSPPAVLTDNNFAFVPKNTAGVNVRLRLPFPATIGEVWLQGDWYTQSSQWLSDINDSPQFGKISGYDLYNAAIEWRSVLGNDNLDARVMVKNLADEEYYTMGLTLEGAGFANRMLGAPRTVTGQVTYRF